MWWYAERHVCHDTLRMIQLHVVISLTNGRRQQQLGLATSRPYRFSTGILTERLFYLHPELKDNPQRLTPINGQRTTVWTADDLIPTKCTIRLVRSKLWPRPGVMEHTPFDRRSGGTALVFAVNGCRLYNMRVFPSTQVRCRVVAWLDQWSSATIVFCPRGIRRWLTVQDPNLGVKSGTALVWDGRIRVAVMRLLRNTTPIAYAPCESLIGQRGRSIPILFTAGEQVRSFSQPCCTTGAFSWCAGIKGFYVRCWARSRGCRHELSPACADGNYGHLWSGVGGKDLDGVGAVAATKHVDVPTSPHPVASSEVVLESRTMRGEVDGESRAHFRRPSIMPAVNVPSFGSRWQA